MAASLKSCLILLFCSVLLNSCGGEKEKAEEVIRPVKVFRVKPPETVLERTFPGKVEAAKKADLAFLVSGRIIEFPVREGDKVEKGELVAKLDPRDFEIAVDEAKAKEEFAKVQLDRKAKLVAKDFIAKSEYDAQKTNYDVAVAQLEIAKQNLEYSELHSPFSGEIATRYVENFQNVVAGQEIVRLQNLDSLDIKLQIPERIAIHSQYGEKPIIEIEFDSAPGKRYPAKIKEVSTVADPETQTYELTLSMGIPKNLTVLPGMTTTVFIKFSLKDKIKVLPYLIPLEAVFAGKQNKSYVWLINPKTHKVTKHPVKTSTLKKDSIVVTEGLSPGMEIVATGGSLLQEGMKVRPLNSQQSNP